MTPKVLITEDDRDIAEMVAISTRLVWPDAEIRIVGSGSEALLAFFSQPFDMVVLDVAIPEPDGLEVCRRIRTVADVPILMLTARTEMVDKIRAFDFGADDYLTKPFDPLELQARLRVLQRHSQRREQDTEERQVVGDLSIDFAAHDVRLAGRAIDLTPTEFRLLGELIRRPGVVIPHDALREQVWNAGRVGDPSDLKVYVRRLRQKLGDDPHAPRYIETIRGIGYRFLLPS